MGVSVKHVRKAIKLFNIVHGLAPDDSGLDKAINVLLDHLVATFTAGAKQNEPDFKAQASEVQHLFELDCPVLFEQVIELPPVLRDYIIPIYMMRHILFCQHKTFDYVNSEGFGKFVRMYKDVILA